MAKNEIGNKYGKLTVIDKAEGMRGSGCCLMWLCKCECGNKKIINGGRLRRGNGLHCGCVKNKARTKHGKTKTTEFNIWQSMLQRCHNPNAANYYNYGGRGIAVCDRWRESFEDFLTDMGSRPSPIYSLDRKENEKGYFKENCRWATPTEQARNKKNTNLIRYRGELVPVINLADKFDIHIETLRTRLRKGWDIESALTAELHKGKRNNLQAGKSTEILKTQ